MVIQQGAMRELALFAGAGGGILAGQLLGWRTLCAVERDAYAAQVLAQRQNDGILEPFPIWSDVETFDGTPWRGRVDVISGGFPCQDISVAGNGEGITGKRSGLWAEFARIIREVQPRFAFVENSPALTSRGLGVVLGDLASMGFDAKWGVLGASDLGAHHDRFRIWIVGTNTHTDHAGQCADQGRGCSTREKRHHPWRLCDQVSNSDCHRLREQQGRICWEDRQGEAFPRIHGQTEQVANSNSNSIQRLEQKSQSCKHRRQTGLCGGEGSRPEWPAWPIEPELGRVANGVACRMDRIKALGNGQVPRVAVAAFEELSER